MKIYKYPLALTDEHAAMMPKGAKLLDVQTQGDNLCIWALIDENAESVPCMITIYGTGHPLPDKPGEYIATFQRAFGGCPMVFHAFDRGEGSE